MKNKILNKKKSALTLAEILIVMAIVTVITVLFASVSMQSRDLQDRAKYYVAYTTLYKLLQEQVADKGTISLNVNTAIEPDCGTLSGDNKTACETTVARYDNKTFGEMVTKWLNTVSHTSTTATLSNGIFLNWEANNSTDLTKNGITTQKVVSVNLDGPEAAGQEGRNLHNFILYRANDGSVRVKPLNIEVDIDDATNGHYGARESNNEIINDNFVDYNNESWIKFKVYKINSDGDGINIVLFDKDYTTAYNCYDNREANECENACENKDCFIEPIKPLK